LICFVIPPSPFLLDERVFMSLGVLKLSAVLEKAGQSVEVLDLSGVENFKEAFEFHVLNTSATCFGFTATTPQMPQAAALARLLKSLRPSLKAIVGGPHPTLTYTAYKREVARGIVGRAHRAMAQLQAVFDVIVAGDGENAIFEAMQDSAPPIIDADDPKSLLFLTNKTLNELPFPARHLVDVESYHYQIDGERAISLIAQLGCPFACGFCGGRNSAMLRRIRTRTTANIVQEIEHLYHAYGVKGFMMYDDELNVNTQMVELMNAIGDLQEGLGVSFKLRGFIKSQLFNDDQARAMYRAGFRWILTGFESGSPRILENMNKKATREENTRCVDIAFRHGLKVKALMSMGHPGESPETIAETKDWLLQVKPNDFDVTIITPYPGSPYHDDAVEENGAWVYRAKNGDKLYAEEVNYFETMDAYKGIPGEYVSHVWTDHFSQKELVKQRDWLEDSVRDELKIPFNPGAPGIKFEASMGQTKLPTSIFKKSEVQNGVPA
jgi:anaerobic magnesium-protoporphyrin IX monomethyl ester cyclase